MMRNIFASGFRLGLSGFIFKLAACSLGRGASCYLLFLFAFWVLSFVLTPLYAEEITILYTGETHAMLYPCNCPKEPEGGVSRRATLIKQLRKDNPDTLVLDSGGFFAGGLMDEYTQNTQLDMQRTLLNLKAMALMQYDALTIGDDEFNFGREFLEENIGKVNLTFLSCNISATNRGGSANYFGGKSNYVLPYITKEVSGTKIGIIGVTSLSVAKKAGDLEFIEPKIAVKEAVEKLEQKNVDIIVLLSHLGENDDLKLIKDIEGIDILIVGHSRMKEGPITKMGHTLILRPFWQGRRLGKLSLTIENKKITDYKVEELRLSDKISGEPGILSILPLCFSDAHCQKEGFIGACLNPGGLNSQCLYREALKVNLLIITSKECRMCDTEKMINYLKTQFAGLVVSYLYYPDAEANKLIRDFNIRGLPVYLLDKEIEKEKGFDNLKENLEIKPVRDYKTTEKRSDVSNGLKGNFYMLKPRFTGVSYLPERDKIEGKLDLFISLYDKYVQQLLEATGDFNPQVHFLTTQEKEDEFSAAGGNLEVEEYLRAVCVQKYYPKIFSNYISCRAKNINSSWWEDCLSGQDSDKIKSCAKGEEGKVLLKEHIRLNRELEIMFGPTYLLDNQQIFSSQGVPTKEELRKILGR